MNNKKAEEEILLNFSNNINNQFSKKNIYDNKENENTKNDENSPSLFSSEIKKFRRRPYNFPPINFSIKNNPITDMKNKEKEKHSLVEEEKKNSNKLNINLSEEDDNNAFFLFDENKNPQKMVESELDDTTIDNFINSLTNKKNMDKLINCIDNEKDICEKIDKIIEDFEIKEKNKNSKKECFQKEDYLNLKVSSKRQNDLEILNKEEKEKDSKDNFKTYIQKAYDEESDYKILLEFQELPYKPRHLLIDLNVFDENSVFKCIIQCNYNIKDKNFILSLNFVYLSNKSELYSKNNKDEILMDYFLEKDKNKEEEKKEEENNNNEYNSENQLEIVINIKKFRFIQGSDTIIARDKKTLIKKNYFNGFQTSIYNIPEDLVNYIEYHKLFYTIDIKKTIFIASKKDFKLKKIGIQNEGNTCYMNSIINSINNNPFLLKNIMSINIDSDIFLRKENKKNKDIIFSIQKVLYKLNKSKYPIKITEIFYSFQWKRIFWNFPQDAEEIYMQIYEIISSYNSDIKNNCEGILENTIEVEEIKYKSSHEENFFFLQLDIDNNHSLEECLNNFFKEEQLSGENKYQYINEFGEKVFYDAIKYFKFKKIPNILFIQLKRFQFDPKTFEFNKNNIGISFREEIDLSNYLENNQSEEKSKKLKNEKEEYTLYCVIVHSGSLKYGHYFCFAKDFKNKCYIKYNDTTVTLAQKKEVFNDNYGGEEIEYQIKNISEYKDNPFYAVKENKREITKNAYIFIYIKKNKINELFNDANNQINDLFEKFSKKYKEENENNYYYKNNKYRDEENGIMKFLEKKPNQNYGGISRKTVVPRKKKNNEYYPSYNYERSSSININMNEKNNFNFENYLLDMENNINKSENKKITQSSYINNKKENKTMIIKLDKNHKLIPPFNYSENGLNDIKTCFFLIDDISDKIKGVFMIEYNTKINVKNIPDKIRSQLNIEKSKNKNKLILDKIVNSPGYKIALINYIGFFIKFLENEEEDITNLLKHEENNKKNIKHLCLYNLKELGDKKIIKNIIIINFISNNLLDLIISKNENIYNNFNFENISPPAFIINEKISELKELIEKIKELYINYFASDAKKNISFKIYKINDDILNLDLLQIQFKEINEINFCMFVEYVESLSNKIDYVNLIVGV